MRYNSNFIFEQYTLLCLLSLNESKKINRKLGPPEKFLENYEIHR